MKINATPLALICASLAPFSAQADSLNLQDILNLKVSVASKTNIQSRQAPGVITVITAEEIQRMGARDLMDVLWMVPGLQFGSDILGQVGLSMRGLWGHEGKILLLWDGQELNDLFFNNTVFGNHYPVDQIARIEVMRGPGSAIYGGNAELAVIKITSKSAQEIGGIRIGAMAGQWGTEYARQTGSVQLGAVRGASEYTVQVWGGRGRRSDRSYTDSLGTRISLEGGSELNPLFLNLGYKRGGFEARAIVDRFRATDQTGYAKSLPTPQALSFDHSSVLLKNTIALSDHLSLTPSFQFRESRPWRFTNSDLQNIDPINYAELYYDKVAQRFTGGLLLDFNSPRWGNFLAGIEFFQDDASSADATLNPVVITDPATGAGLARVRYSNFASYMQAMIDSPIALFTLGARFEDHSRFGSSFVPRIAATRIVGQTHFKLLASRAFRAPSIETINLNSAILPERTNTFEFEVGQSIGETTHLSLNLFDQMIFRPILYLSDVSLPGGEGYFNFDRSGTRGAELQLTSRIEQSTLRASYSFYRPHDNRVSATQVGPDSTQTLANASHKLTFHLTQQIGENWSLQPWAVFLSRRWAYAYDPGLATNTFQSINPSWLLNLHLTRENLIIPGLELGAGVFNLLGQGFVIPQAYQADPPHSPLPSLAREWVVRTAYKIAL